VETGSCCPDMPLSGDFGPKYPCRHLWDFGKDVAVPRAEFGDNWYHVIDACPNFAEDPSYQKCNQPTEIQDYVMVTETRTGRVYRNKHCAECNGIRNYVSLNLRIVCKDMLSMAKLSTQRQREKYVMENCSLMVHLKTKIKGMSHCVPKSETITTCNITGKWDFYNKELDEGCKANNIDRNTIFMNFPGGNYYANVYCYLCNVNSLFHKEVDTCEISNERKDDKSGIISLFVILDANLWTEETVANEGGRCQLTQIWDPYMVS
jgi:hypothetical protein